MTTLASRPADAIVRTAEDRDLEERWGAWRAKGARADARARRRAICVAGVLFAGSVLWIAFEVVRASSLAP